MNSVQLRRALFIVWSFSPEIVLMSRRMLFPSSSRVSSCKRIVLLQTGTTAVLHSCGSNHFVVLRADVFEALFVWACLLRYVLDEYHPISLLPAQLISCLAFGLVAIRLFSAYCWPSCSFLSGCPVNWHRNFCDIFQKAHYLKFNRRCSTAYPSGGTLLHHWRTEKRTEQQPTRGFTPSVTGDSKTYTPAWKVRESLHGRMVKGGLWPLCYPDLTRCIFHLWKF